MIDFGLLILRVTLGALMMGHGSQKLLGWFGGPGHEGTKKMMESQQLAPSSAWATIAEASELGGGALMTLGLLNPLGPMGVLGSMGVATFRTHWGKPIWVTSGGAELPVTNIAIATALAVTGPGKYSLDEAFGTKLPRWVVLPGLALVAAGVAGAIYSSQIAAKVSSTDTASQIGNTPTQTEIEAAGGASASAQKQDAASATEEGQKASFSI